MSSTEPKDKDADRGGTFAKLRAMLRRGEIGPGSNARRLSVEVLTEIEQEGK